MITVIGIGTEKGELTEKAVATIEKANGIILRTAQSKAGKEIAKRFSGKIAQTLDALYNESGDFEAFNVHAADLLSDAAKSGDLLYLTDGDGYDDGVVRALLQKGQEVTILAGVSPHYAKEASDGRFEATATAFVSRAPYLDGRTAVHITELDNAYLAGDVKLQLMKAYGDETPVTLVLKNKKIECKLFEIDRQSGYGYDAELFIAQNDTFMKGRYTYADLVRIVARLSAPDGCPWDKVQTHESIRTNMIEEAYEAVDAIDRGDRDGMIEEFGDVLLQSVFQADMARRAGEFDESDVMSALCEKLVFRHRHIFGAEKAADAAEALKVWEEAKADEKREHTLTEKVARLPESFPSLLSAQKIAGKLEKAGAVTDYEARYDRALKAGDYGAALYYLGAQMRQEGIDAEVELNGFLRKVKNKIAQYEQSGTLADLYKEE